MGSRASETREAGEASGRSRIGGEERMVEEFAVEREGMTFFCKRFAPEGLPGDPGSLRAEEGAAPGVRERPPLLMVHGGLVDCDFFDGAATVLSRLFDVVTYDRRGYGRSDDPPSGEFDLAEQAEDAFAVASACFDAPFSLITHSVGASIGLGLMARHPGAVSRALIHEPLVLSCVPPDSDLAQVVAETRAATHRASVGSIGDGFLFGLAPKDDRAYEPSESERARTARNTSCSIVNEGSLFVSFEPDYEAVVQVPAVVGLGELGRTSPIGIIVETFARRAGMPVAHFPGAHNCPADLPCDFACMTTGLFATGWTPSGC